VEPVGRPYGTDHISSPLHSDVPTTLVPMGPEKCLRLLFSHRSLYLIFMWILLTSNAQIEGFDVKLGIRTWR
jgi:hypothetical protein